MMDLFVVGFRDPEASVSLSVSRYELENQLEMSTEGQIIELTTSDLDQDKNPKRERERKRMRMGEWAESDIYGICTRAPY